MLFVSIQVAIILLGTVLPLRFWRSFRAPAPSRPTVPPTASPARA
jgi:hypothetical protein